MFFYIAVPEVVETKARHLPMQIPFSRMAHCPDLKRGRGIPRLTPTLYASHASHQILVLDRSLEGYGILTSALLLSLLLPDVVLHVIRVGGQA